MYTTATSRGHYYGGSWRHSVGSSKEILGFLPKPAWVGSWATDEEADSAVASALQAFSSWASLALQERLAVLERFAGEIKSNKDEIAKAIAISSGKPLWEAQTEVNSIAGKMQPTISASRLRATDFAPAEAGRSSRTLFRPHGPTVVLGPYNFPIHMPNVHVLPLLLAGNTVVMKPSELVPYPAELYASCLDRAGIPAGVFNMIHGDAAVGARLVSHPACRAVCFTGSATVGRKIEQLAAQRRVMIAAEMGGNSPLVFWDTNDLRASVYVALQSCFVTSGQRCSSARRLIVQDNTHGRLFVERFAAAAAVLRIGLPLDDPQPFFGPMVNARAAQAALDWQAEMEMLGGNVVLRSLRSDSCPALISPGIVDITSVDRARLPDKEVMGPVISLQFCRTFGDAIEICNDSQFGLAAGLIASDPSRYDLFSGAIEAGVLAWNAPLTGSSAWAAFGGIKNSGNYRPTGFFSADYAVRAVGVTENAEIQLPGTLPPGMTL